MADGIFVFRMKTTGGSGQVHFGTDHSTEKESRKAAYYYGHLYLSIVLVHPSEKNQQTKEKNSGYLFVAAEHDCNLVRIIVRHIACNSS